MADAFEDRLKDSLMNISKEMGETKKVNVPEKNQFVGFDAVQKASTWLFGRHRATE